MSLFQSLLTRKNVYHAAGTFFLLLTHFSSQIADSSANPTAKGELDSIIKAVLSGKYDADFLEHQTWGLLGIQCLAELIKEGTSSTFATLKTSKEHIVTKERQHIQLVHVVQVTESLAGQPGVQDMK